MRTLLAVCLAVGLIGLAQAQEKRPGSPAEQIKAIEKDFETTLKNANAELQKAAPGTQQTIVAKAREKFSQFVKEASAIAEAGPNDPAGIRALAFVAGRGGMAGTPDQAQAAGAAARTVKEKHLEKAGIGLALPSITQPAPDGKDILRNVLAKNKDAETQVIAAFLLGSKLVQESDRAPAEKAAAMTKEAEGLLARAEKEGKDATFNGQSLAKEAGDKLYLIRNLSVGKMAPDVEGTDLDGKKVKLSNYRGKVIVLDIWATWCPPCRAMIPHEREMVKKLEKKPFVLVSVSADAKKETLTEFLQKEPMPWTHWWDGQSGKVAEAFKVEFFPNIYVIDATGVIRHKQLRGEELEKAVEALVKEAEVGKG